MAVLVQRLVPADAAGVAFTANPVTGDRGETLVSAVRGLGERLVSGGATPQEWVIADGTARCTEEADGGITASQALDVAELAERIEAQLGTPQDIEWAIAGGTLHLLQARPITALPRPPVVEIPEHATLLKDTVHYPEQVTPFGASVYFPSLETALREMFATFGLLLERMDQYCIGGEVFGRPVPVGAGDGPPRAAPPWWVMAILSRVVPPMRRRMAAARHAVRSGLLESLPRRWDREWRDEFRRADCRLRSMELGSLSDVELERTLDEAIALLGRGQHVHMQLFAPNFVAVYELVATCRDLLGWDPLEAFELVAGLSDASSEPARMLARLADQIRERPAARAAMAEGGADVLDRLRATDPETAEALAGYLDEYGWRATGFDPGAPVLAERPELFVHLLRDAVAADPSEAIERELAGRRERAEARAREALAGRRLTDLLRFEAVLRTGRSVYGLREDNVCWTDSAPCAAIRRVALEIGRRLAARGMLRDADEISFLEVQEARRALRGDADVLPRAAVARRRAEWAWVAAHPGPPFLGPPPAPQPDVRGLPAEARRINRAMMWIMDQEYAVAPDATGEALAGVPGSPGRYTGAVRIIRSEAEFGRLRRGEVLVCPITTPVWSVLFGTAGALVTDGGGVVSHAAIVAREHGVPAVLGARTATRELKDGQIVTVDGTSGTVHLVSTPGTA